MSAAKTKAPKGDDTFLQEEKVAAEYHFKKADRLSRLQGFVMGAVAVAGFITAYAGSPASAGSLARDPNMLLLMGLVAALGSMVSQFGGFSERIAENRSRADYHRGIVAGLTGGFLNKKQAAQMVTAFFHERASKTKKV